MESNAYVAYMIVQWKYVVSFPHADDMNAVSLQIWIALDDMTEGEALRYVAVALINLFPD